jgi:hypothetical protein
MPERPARFIQRGDDAMDNLRKEQEAAAQRREQAGNRGPMRFWTDKDGRGGWKTHEIVFLDDDLTQAAHVYEHDVDGPGNDFKKRQHVSCIDDWASCPICRAAENNVADEFKPPRYNMFGTVLDLTPYTIQKGANAGVTREHSRKLYVIPMAMMDTFKQMFELCKRQNGTTRGMVCMVTKKEKNDARCGEPQMIKETGMLFDWMDEDELGEFADDAVVREGKTILEEGENIEPYDYEEILAPKTEEELRTMFNIDPPMGSRASEREDSAPAGRSRRSRRTAAPEQEPEDEGTSRRSRRSRTAEPEEEPEDKPARRSRASAPKKEEEPAPRQRRSRRQKEAPMDSEGGDDGDIEIPFDDGDED